jgi:hypothetical protein
MLCKNSLTVFKYIEDYPGLVHFIYIDRTSNTLVAPSLSILNKEDKLDATRMIKEKVRNVPFDNSFARFTQTSDQVVIPTADIDDKSILKKSASLHDRAQSPEQLLHT